MARKKRSRNIVIKSQFNIGGSRGKSVKHFITQYVSRESAVKPVFGYRPQKPTYEVGDGSCFTFSKTAISRDNVLKIADRVEELFLTNKRAIQQLVISFDADYLKEMNIVDKNTTVLNKGDYEDKYDELRLRHVIRRGVHEIAERDGYHNPKMIGTIQHDTHHIHAHVVLYEDSDKKIGRKYKNEERGMLKQKSFYHGSQEMERVLYKTRKINVTRDKMLLTKTSINEQDKKEELVSDVNISSFDIMQEYLNLLYLQKLKEKEERKEKILGMKNQRNDISK